MIKIKKDLFANNKIEYGEYKEDLFKIKKLPFKKDDTKLLLKGLKKIGKRRRYFSGKHQHDFITRKKDFRNTDKRQLCVVKFYYGKNKNTHKQYLKKYMPQLDKEEVIEKPEYFGDDVSLYEANITSKHFKFIISPDNQNVDLKVLTKTLVEQLNILMDCDLYWVAVEHNDTAHKHVHLLINGKDKNGKFINKIDKQLVKSTIRELARENCTKMVGERTVEEIKNYLTDEYKKNRVTYIDRIIYKELSGNTNTITPRNETIRKRLDYLISLNLSEKKNNKYSLKENWFDTLQNFGRYNTYLEVRNLYQYKNKKIEIYNQNGGISGKVLKIYNMDEEKIWNNAAVIETENTIYYVPSYFKINVKMLNKNVKIQTVTNSKGKNAITINQL
ncbi:relaxase/mobilization nuclease domain-containing protein [Treponema pedis]|uniref:relaxase/mobilization nuclease domain-containing protein n=1 Tax=Treponema pedis TaxID=409322 RepID=UPI00041CE8AD|nr:hypothetical protein [Treponema pedis]